MYTPFITAAKMEYNTDQNFQAIIDKIYQRNSRIIVSINYQLNQCLLDGEGHSISCCLEDGDADDIAEFYRAFGYEVIIHKGYNKNRIMIKW